jgi:hypothetical protein
MVSDDFVTEFLAPLEYVVDGSRHTVVCEGTWKTVGGETHLRLDSEHFLAFWLAGRIVDGGLHIDGGRLDDSWTDAPVHHSQFTCSAEDEVTFVVRYGEVLELVIPRPGTKTLLGFASESETVKFPSSLGTNFTLHRR